MDETPRTPPEGQQPLPFDDESDRPVPYQLTARARREVAPERLPDLAVVRPADVTTARAPAGAPWARTDRRPERASAWLDDGALEEAGDTRPSRARALRRAGMAVPAIARRLDADELAVRAWVGDLADRRAARAADTAASDPDGRRLERRAASGESDPPGASRAYRRSRRHALESAGQRLRTDASFAAGLGLLAGVADVDEHSIGLTTRDPRIAATVVRWLVDHAGASPARVRVVLRLGPRAAADLARHRWAEALGVAREQITHTRWRGSPDEEEALVRVGDPAVAGAVSGWTQVLLEPSSPEPLDAAF